MAGTRTLRSTAASPGSATILGARVLGEFGDDPDRYLDARARKNYAGTSPITRASGKKKVVLARYVHNDRLVDATAPTGLQRAERLTRRPRLLRPASAPAASATTPRCASSANRLVGILHGCLKTGHPTTRPPPGPTTPNKINNPLLDTPRSWDV